MVTGTKLVQTKSTLVLFDTKVKVVRKDPNGTGAKCTTILHTFGFEDKDVLGGIGVGAALGMASAVA